MFLHKTYNKLMIFDSSLTNIFYIEQKSPGMKRLFWLLLLALFIIQFSGPKKILRLQLSPTDIATKYAVPAEVKPILQRACLRLPFQQHQLSMVQ